MQGVEGAKLPHLLHAFQICVYSKRDFLPTPRNKGEKSGTELVFVFAAPLMLMERPVYSSQMAQSKTVYIE